MKKIFLFLLLFSCGMTLAGQTSDTTFISISQEDAPLEKQQLMDHYDQVFSTLEPTRWLFALNFSAITDQQDDLLRSSAEVKILPAISLHGSYGFGYDYSPPSPYSRGRTVEDHRFAVEPRWYYAMPRRIRQGKSANNMSGNYIGLEAVYLRTNTNTGRYSILGDQRSLALRYGLQRRLFRYGFLDMGFGVGVVKEYGSAWQQYPSKRVWNLFANSEIGLGLALARPKATASAGGYCDVLRCFREERQMWKVDLYNLLRINTFDDLKGRLSVGYERKIGASPFSLEAQGEWNLQHIYHSIGQYYESTQRNTTHGATLQSRYYYSQQKRIAKGKSGNNLSGVYVGAQFRWLEKNEQQRGYYCGTSDCSPFSGEQHTQSTSGGLVWGIQHRLFQKGFVDFQVVGSQDQLRTKYSPQADAVSSRNFNVALRLRAGLAF